MMPRIAIIVGRLTDGGLTRHALQEAGFLAKNGFEVLIISSPCSLQEHSAAHLVPESESIVHRSIPGFQRNFGLFGHFRTYVRIRQLLNDFKPKVVHTHSPVAGVAGRLAAASLKIPAVHTYHGLLFTGYYGRSKSRLIILLERWLGKYTAALLAISNGQRELLAYKYRIAPFEKITVVPIGIDVTPYGVGASNLWRDQTRRTYGIDNQHVVVAIVGRLVAIKNHRQLIDAIKLAIASMPQLRLLVVGDGEKREELLQYCSNVGISHSFFPEKPKPADVIFTGWQTNMPQIMAAVDIVALSSINEGTPLSIMEAMAAGRPVVATKVGGIPEMIQNGYSGILVNEQQSVDFAQALLALATHPELRASMGENARNFAASHFSAERNLQEIVAVFKRFTG